MRKGTLTLFLILLVGYTFSQTKETAPYLAGFTTIHLVDSSRTYKPNSPLTDSLHYRPLDLDIWYPSHTKTEKPLFFGDLFRLHEERANAYENSDYSGYSEELAMFFAVGLGLEPEDGKRLLKIKSGSYPNVPRSKGNFPLVIYMAGYNGMGWESYRLLEKLAENGFIVVSISSIGRYPGNMSNDLLDTMEQVYDGEFALKVLKEEKNFSVDFDKIGILGLSWGGMSGAIMLGRHPGIKAMVSLDGSEVFYFGDTEIDDTFLT